MGVRLNYGIPLQHITRIRIGHPVNRSEPVLQRVKQFTKYQAASMSWIIIALTIICAGLCNEILNLRIKIEEMEEENETRIS